MSAEASAQALAAYLPHDRRVAVARQSALPSHAVGAVLFADLSGFTPLTEALTETLGARRGVEALMQKLDAVYGELIAAVERAGGSVLSFHGDAIMGWFSAEEGSAAWRAVACGLAMQVAMQTFDGLALRVGMAYGGVRRFVVGDLDIQLIDTLAGVTVDRAIAAQMRAEPGTVLVDAPLADLLAESVPAGVWGAPDSAGFVVVHSLPDLPAWGVRPVPVLAVGAEAWRTWVLPAVYAREVAGHGAFLTELRPVVALFVGFTGIVYARDEAAVQLDLFVRSVQIILVRHGGVLVDLTVGEADSQLYAAFGAPVAHEDDSVRAVQAAFEVREMAARLGYLAPLKLGISRGTMRTGAYGSATRRTYGVLGDEVNVAARLMQSAAAGEILISERVCRALGVAGERFACAPLPALRVKGKREPVAVFVVTRARAERLASRLLEPVYTVPLAGRQAELARVREMLDAALAGRGQVAAFVAEAGLGKSRLIAEAMRLAHARGFIALGGACQSDSTHTSYFVWQPIWQTLFDVDYGQPQVERERVVQAAVARLAPERVEAWPLLDAALGLTLADNDFTRTLEPQFRHSALNALLLDCLRAAAEEVRSVGAGLLLVLEDVHWIDPLSRALLEEIALVLGDLPIMVLLAYRPAAEVDGWPGARLRACAHFVEFALTELDAQDATQVLRAQFARRFGEPPEAVPEDLVARILARAQGNPFYIEELLNYLHDRAVDLHDTAVLERLDLPASLHSLILSRIDQLATSQQLTLKVASIIGRVFRVAYLHGYYPLLGAVDAVRADLAELSRLDLTPLETPEPELAYLFKHIVTREVAYESLPYSTRAALHEQYAHFIETMLNVDMAGYLDTLVFHYGHSGNHAKTRHYARLAGEASAARFANTEALAYFARALALTPEDEHETRYALLLARERVYDLQAARVAQQQDLEALEALAERFAERGDLQPRALIAVRQAQAAEKLGDYARVLALGARGAEVAEACRARALQADANTIWARGLWRLGRYDEAWERAALALPAAQASGARASELDAVRMVGVIAWAQGRMTEAQAYFKRHLALARAAGDRRHEGAALNNLGILAQNLGDYGAAQDAYLQSRRMAHEIGDQHGLGLAYGNLGGIAWVLGDFAGAWEAFTLSLQMCQANANRRGECYALIGLSRLLQQRGDFVAAEDHALRAWAGARALGDRGLQSLTLVVRGGIALERGDIVAAQACYAESLAMRQDLGQSHRLAEPLAGLAEAALAAGDVAGARARVDAILTLLAGGPLRGLEDPMRVQWTCYRVLVAAGEAGTARRVLEDANVLLLKRVACISGEERQRVFLEGIAVHRALRAALGGPAA